VFAAAVPDVLIPHDAFVTAFTDGSLVFVITLLVMEIPGPAVYDPPLPEPHSDPVPLTVPDTECKH
jgi:hypothetical protein